MKPRSSVLAVVAAILGIAAACSSSNGSGGTPSDAGTESGPSSSSGGSTATPIDGEAVSPDGSSGAASSSGGGDGSSEGSADGSGGSDATTPDTGSASDSSAVLFPTDPTCSTQFNSAPGILTNLVMGSPVGFMGGSIAGGTYYVTAKTAYTADASCSYVDPCANSIGNSTTMSVLALSDNAGTIDIATETCLGKSSCVAYCYTTSGSTITLLKIADIASDPTCAPGVGDAGMLTYSYTATPTELSLHLPDDGSIDACAVTFVQTATKQ